MNTEEKIFEILKPIQDPELGASIVDLGLIYKVGVNGKQVDVTMTFTTPLCPFGQSLVKSIQDSLRRANYIPKVEVTFNPPWGINMIKTELREQFLFAQDVV